MKNDFRPSFTHQLGYLGSNGPCHLFVPHTQHNPLHVVTPSVPSTCPITAPLPVLGAGIFLCQPRWCSQPWWPTTLLFVCQSWNNCRLIWPRRFTGIVSAPTQCSMENMHSRLRWGQSFTTANKAKLQQKPQVLSGTHGGVCSVRKLVINITTNCCLMSEISYGRKGCSTNFIGINTQGVGSLVM